MIIERPYKLSYSKNDIRYIFQLADLTRAGLLLQVKILYAEIGSSSFNELPVFDLKPNTDGYVYVYIQNYLDSLLNYVLPTNGQTITIADNQAKQFYILYREVTDESADPAWINYEILYTRIVFKGGVEKNKFDRNNFFSNYLLSQKPFLTWQPKNHFIFFNENVYLTFINPTIGTALKLKIYCVATDNSTNTILLNIQGTALLYHINIGPAALNLNAFNTKKNFYYDISITDTAGSTILVNPYRFYMEYRPLYDAYYDLVYFNSLGGVDSVRVIGETSVAANRDYDTIEGGMKLDWTDSVSAFESSFTNLRIQRQYKGDIGYLRNRNKLQQESFLEMLCGYTYQLIANRWISVSNLQKSVDLGTNKDTKQSFPIEWSLSENNEVFTPEKIVLGSADNDVEVIVVPPPTNLVVNHESITEPSRTLYLQWDEPAATTGAYEVELFRVSNNYTDIRSSGPPPFDISLYTNAFPYKFRVRMVISATEYSGWSNQITVNG